MARKQAKCGSCEDLLFFVRDSDDNQSVTCTCGATTLSESGATGDPVPLSAAEKESLMEGIVPADVTTMRAIFDADGNPRPQHCFRWSVAQSRWELSRVLPGDRTLLAYLDGNEWVEL